MEFIHNTEYPSDKTFTPEELVIVTPNEIYQFMCLKTYGIENPDQDDVPQLQRSSSLAYIKKSLSFFMPNTETWNEIRKEGNPTKSKLINNLIKAVQKKECRGLGVESKADRAFTDEEFSQLIDLFGRIRGENGRRFSAMAKYQLQLIARGDDTCHTKKSCFEQSTQFPDYLIIKMRWSKNVSTAADCPQQIILGSLNAKYCAVLGIAIWIEKWLRDGEGVTSQWMFSNGTTTSTSPIKEQDRESSATNTSYGCAIRAIIRHESFTASPNKGALGTHSIKKYAATRARRSGLTKDVVDYRARWKMDGRTQDRYVDVQLDWPDVYCASKLCVGGICVYKPKAGSGITNEWLANLLPATRSSLGSGVARILATSLAWACFDEGAVDMVPPDIRVSIVNEFITLDSIVDGNPIERVEVLASENEGMVNLDEIPNQERESAGLAPIPGAAGHVVGNVEGNAEVAGNAAGNDMRRINLHGGNLRSIAQWRAAMYAKASITQVRITEMQQLQIAKYAEMNNRLKKLERQINVINAAPTRVLGGGRIIVGNTANIVVEARAGTAGAGGDQRPATLQSCPKTVSLLWDEYVNGVGGRKPARLFTIEEQNCGGNKHKYFRRRRLWQIMDRLTRRGHDVASAVDLIHSVYGYRTMSKILDAMIVDEKNGGHHRLR